jgi:hypothetical protein
MPEEVLHQGIMEALGYSRNRGPFEALARGLPLRTLRRHLLGVGPPGRLPLLRALLLGGAGFLDQESPPVSGADDLPLVEAWREAGLEVVVEPDAWRLFRIRPGNHPRLRLLGAAALLDRWWAPGLLEEMAGRVVSGGVPELRDALVVRAPATGRALIGADRAGEMAVNAVLPFLHAWGRLARRPEVARAALRVYHAWPPLQANEITREMEAQLAARRARFQPAAESAPGAPPRPFGQTARHQQGMLHMYGRPFGDLGHGPPFTRR